MPRVLALVTLLGCGRESLNYTPPQETPCSPDFCSLASTLPFSQQETHHFNGTTYQIQLGGLFRGENDIWDALFRVQAPPLFIEFQSHPPLSPGDCTSLGYGNQLLFLEAQIGSGSQNPSTADYCLLPREETPPEKEFIKKKRI